MSDAHCAQKACGTYSPLAGGRRVQQGDEVSRGVLFCAEKCTLTISLLPCARTTCDMSPESPYAFVINPSTVRSTPADVALWHAPFAEVVYSTPASYPLLAVGVVLQPGDQISLGHKRDTCRVALRCPDTGAVRALNLHLRYSKHYTMRAAGEIVALEGASRAVYIRADQ